MKYLLFTISGLFLFSSCNAQFGKLLKQVTGQDISSDDVANGLKEALSKGTNKGTELLSQKDGYFKSIYKIMLPEDAKRFVINCVRFQVLLPLKRMSLKN